MPTVFNAIRACCWMPMGITGESVVAIGYTRRRVACGGLSDLRYRMQASSIRTLLVSTEFPCKVRIGYFTSVCIGDLGKITVAVGKGQQRIGWVGIVCYRGNPAIWSTFVVYITTYLPILFLILVKA